MGKEGGSLRHVVHKRVHLERQQPKARQRLGYLEKHKDYIKRAKNFHQKEDTIKLLHRKAYFKNEDEFAFGMASSVMKDGRWLQKTKHLSNDELKLLESQDATYVGLRERMDKKAAVKQTSTLHFLDADRPNKHTLFVDEDELATCAGSSSSSSGRKASLKNFDTAKYLDTHPDLLQRKANRLRLQQLESKTVEETEDMEGEKKMAYKELFHRQERAKRLRKVREELELRQNLRSKGRRKKVAEATDKAPAMYKWAFQRKR